MSKLGLQGDISTDFIKDEFPDGFIPLPLEPAKQRGLFTAAMQMLALAGIANLGLILTRILTLSFTLNSISRRPHRRRMLFLVPPFAAC